MAQCERLVLHAEDGRATRWKQSGQHSTYRCADYFSQRNLWLRGSGSEVQSRFCLPSCVPGETLAFNFPQKDHVLRSHVPTGLLLPVAVAFSDVFKRATRALLLWSASPFPDLPTSELH